ncbi:hypothetical protein BZG36_00565 [Bifiguratus adelaidae]|uniref:SPIN90/Ldb17 leucine-rich domain-containing protein n=1 Tax=Bifiguratus adelaidae TaxID=1938954 RepID=A0A261Y7L5_9FUNG|nr:hypothetical protein BZG36_00565 [Bifiguratus adelaidae]
MDHGIVYHFDSKYEFYAELDEVLSASDSITQEADVIPIIDTFVGFLTSFQDEYLCDTNDLAHAIYKLLDATVYINYHTYIVQALIRQRALKTSNPRDLYVIYCILLFAGKDDIGVLKYIVSVSSNTKDKSKNGVPPAKQSNELVAKLKYEIANFLGGERCVMAMASLLFEICRVCRLDGQDLETFNVTFISYLLDVVEKTCDDTDEAFNYTIIRLILAVNEQFMMLQTGQRAAAEKEGAEQSVIKNNVMEVLIARMGTAKTFGGNLIFMLNRTTDPCVQLLILKLLYLIFTTPESYEYFYTNDLCVLVDVILRELCDLGDENEALRHTFLRVLTPLLVNTQLRHNSYKRTSIHTLLLTMLPSRPWKPVNPTTQRLVRRALIEWWEGVCGEDVAPTLGDDIGLEGGQVAVTNGKTRTAAVLLGS